MKNKAKETYHSSPSPSQSPAEVTAARLEQVRRSVPGALGEGKREEEGFFRALSGLLRKPPIGKSLASERQGRGSRRARGEGGEEVPPCAGLDPIWDPWHPSEERRLRPNRAMVSKHERGPGGF